MGLVLITPPSAAILSTEAARLHVRADESNGDIEDDAIADMVAAAVDQVEQFLCRPLLAGSYRFTTDAFPRWSRDRDGCDSSIYLPIGGVSEITRVGYVDINGAPQTLDTGSYAWSVAEPIARVAPAFEKAWPEARRSFDAVTVEFTAGYGADPAAVPRSIVAAVKLILGHLFANREETVVGTTAACIPNGAEHLLWPHRVFALR